MEKYTEEQLQSMLLPKTKDANDLKLRDEAIQYIFNHPENVHPFMYAELAAALASQGNLEQGAFWFYLFQSRSGVWVAKDPNQSGYAALKASFNQSIGGVINKWIGSDIKAWNDLAERAISYEEKFPFYKGKVESVSDDEWNKSLTDERKKFKADFTGLFAELLKNDAKDSETMRKNNGLYVGPWQNPGKPLLDNWK